MAYNEQMPLTAEYCPTASDSPKGSKYSKKQAPGDGNGGRCRSMPLVPGRLLELELEPIKGFRDRNRLKYILTKIYFYTTNLPIQGEPQRHKQK